MNNKNHRESDDNQSKSLKSAPVTFFILAGKKESDNLPQSQVNGLKDFLVRDLIEKIKDINKEIIDRIMVFSNDETFLANIISSDERVIIHAIPSKPFYFYPWLKDSMKKYQPHKVFYWGSGASPFITSKFLKKICQSIIESEDILYTNNFFSSDWVVFTPAEKVLTISPPAKDNNLAYLLWQDAGLKSVYLEPSVEIVGDVDTPLDLAILKVHPSTGKYSKEYLNTINIDTHRVQRFVSLLKGKNRVFLGGRVGSALFRYLDTRSICRFRILSEERGMKSSGRLERGQVRSLMATMIENMGLDGFFRFVEETSDGAVIDSRVIFAHICKRVSVGDRFYSDLGEPDKIKDPFVAEFTRRVMQSPIPILTGGHSLILGGLWAMVSAFGELAPF